LRPKTVKQQVHIAATVSTVLHVGSNIQCWRGPAAVYLTDWQNITAVAFQPSCGLWTAGMSAGTFGLNYDATQKEAPFQNT
jgi:hypothetical protein